MSIDNPPRVFISYSHDSETVDFVRELSERLRNDGVDCLIDLYVNGSPYEGWQRWMLDQIEAADFVLLVCTPNYIKRFRGKETDGGRGVTFEGVVISQTLYDNYHHNSKFIPVIPTSVSLKNVPLMMKPYTTYRLPGDYHKLYRVLTAQAEYVKPSLGELRILPVDNTQPLATRIHIDRLPTVNGEFVGREDELQLLSKAHAGNGTRVIQFIAAGGTGKTKLLRHWLNQNAAEMPNRIVWSFYSQGAAEDKQVSTSQFFFRH